MAGYNFNYKSNNFPPLPKSNKFSLTTSTSTTTTTGKIYTPLKSSQTKQSVSKKKLTDINNRRKLIAIRRLKDDVTNRKYSSSNKTLNPFNKPLNMSFFFDNFSIKTESPFNNKEIDPIKVKVIESIDNTLPHSNKNAGEVQNVCDKTELHKKFESKCEISETSIENNKDFNIESKIIENKEQNKFDVVQNMNIKEDSDNAQSLCEETKKAKEELLKILNLEKQVEQLKNLLDEQTNITTNKNANEISTFVNEEESKIHYLENELQKLKEILEEQSNTSSNSNNNNYINNANYYEMHESYFKHFNQMLSNVQSSNQLVVQITINLQREMDEIKSFIKNFTQYINTNNTLTNNNINTLIETRNVNENLSEAVSETFEDDSLDPLVYREELIRSLTTPQTTVSFNIENFDYIPTRKSTHCSQCFMSLPLAKGFILRKCLHIFCIDCLKNAVSDGIIMCPFKTMNGRCDNVLIPQNEMNLNLTEETNNNINENDDREENVICTMDETINKLNEEINARKLCLIKNGCLPKLPSTIELTTSNNNETNQNKFNEAETLNEARALNEPQTIITEKLLNDVNEASHEINYDLLRDCKFCSYSNNIRFSYCKTCELSKSRNICDNSNEKINKCTLIEEEKEGEKKKKEITFSKEEIIIGKTPEDILSNLSKKTDDETFQKNFNNIDKVNECMFFLTNNEEEQIKIKKVEWVCEFCTFINENNLKSCAICFNDKVDINDLINLKNDADNNDSTLKDDQKIISINEEKNEAASKPTSLITFKDIKTENKRPENLFSFNDIPENVPFNFSLEKTTDAKSNNSFNATMNTSLFNEKKTMDLSFPLPIQTKIRWSCEKCTLINENNLKSCVMCETPRAAEEPTAAIINSKSSDWLCYNCSKMNKRADRNCYSCDFEYGFIYKKVIANDGREVMEYIKDKRTGQYLKYPRRWLCSRCSTYNENNDIKCDSCRNFKTRKVKYFVQ